MNYIEQLKHPKWQRKRLEILERDDFTCQVCGDEETQLNVHHKSYSKTVYEVDNSQLITLCKHCHSITHKINDISSYKVEKSINETLKLTIYLLMGEDAFVSFLIDDISGEVTSNGVFPLMVLNKVIKFYNNK